MLKETLAALSVITLATSAVALPTATAKAADTPNSGEMIAYFPAPR